MVTTTSKKSGSALFRKSQTRRRSSGIQPQSRMSYRAQAAISSSDFRLIKNRQWIFELGDQPQTHRNAVARSQRQRLDAENNCPGKSLTKSATCGRTGIRELQRRSADSRGAADV